MNRRKEAAQVQSERDCKIAAANTRAQEEAAKQDNPISDSLITGMKRSKTSTDKKDMTQALAVATNT